MEELNRLFESIGEIVSKKEKKIEDLKAEVESLRNGWDKEKDIVAQLKGRNQELEKMFKMVDKVQGDYHKLLDKAKHGTSTE